MTHKTLSVLTIFILFTTLLLTGCNQAGANTSTGDNLSGTITISGAWALYPMVISWSEAFQEEHPKVKFDISAGGAGKGMADALSNAVDLGMVSRDIHPEEQAKGAFWVSVTKDAVFLTVNQNNPVWAKLHTQGVTQETLTGIYITGEITTWGQVVGDPANTDPIHIFTRSDACGASDAWSAFLDKHKQEDLLGLGVFGDPGVLDAVIKDPLGIGYNNLNYAFDMETGKPVAGAMVVPLDVNGNGTADPEELYDTKAQAVEAVAKNNYPAPPARELNLVSNGAPTGLSKTFLTWILTDGQKYVEEAGYITLPAERITEELGKLK